MQILRPTIMPIKRSSRGTLAEILNARKHIVARANERIQHIFNDPYIVYHQTMNDYGMLNKHYEQYIQNKAHKPKMYKLQRNAEFSKRCPKCEFILISILEN